MMKGTLMGSLFNLVHTAGVEEKEDFNPIDYNIQPEAAAAIGIVADLSCELYGPGKIGCLQPYRVGAAACLELLSCIVARGLPISSFRTSAQPPEHIARTLTRREVCEYTESIVDALKGMNLFLILFRV
jgi:hypothetical protein